MSDRPDKIPTPDTPIIPAPAGVGDPRLAPFGNPIAVPDPDRLYPQEGLPYVNPDRDPANIPVVEYLAPATAVVGSTSFTIGVFGGTFDADTEIMWNGSPEPTTLVAPNHVTTGVNMGTVTGPSIVPVGVRSGTGRLSNTLPFEFVAP